MIGFSCLVPGGYFEDFNPSVEGGRKLLDLFNEPRPSGAELQE